MIVEARAVYSFEVPTTWGTERVYLDQGNWTLLDEHGGAHTFFAYLRTFPPHGTRPAANDSQASGPEELGP